MADSVGYSIINSYAGVGFSRSWINCDAAVYATYTEEVLVISKLRGKKSTVYEVLLALVFVK